jgi:hypothetical protein
MIERDSVAILFSRKTKKNLRIVGTKAEIRIYRPGIQDKSVTAWVTFLSTGSRVHDNKLLGSRADGVFANPLSDYCLLKKYSALWSCSFVVKHATTRIFT